MRRVAVTGIGAVSPGGVGTEALWALVTRDHDARVQPEVPDFDGPRWFDRRELRRTERYVQYAVAAAVEAWEHAGSPPLDGARTGVVLGNAFGASAAVDRASASVATDGAEAVPPAVGLAACSSSCAAAVSRHFGVTGHVAVTSGACASGIYGIVDGARLIAHGEADAVFAGGTEGPVGPVVGAAYANLRAVSRSGWVRPFDRRRDGFVYAEGAAVLVLEAWDVAVARGAAILGEVAGWANTNDAGDMVRPTGVGAEACMRLALERSGLGPEAIAHVNAHGTGTVLNDTTEAAAIRSVLGPTSAVSVTSVKGSTGHGAGAAGAIEAAVVLLSFAHRLLPPVAVELELDPAITLDVVAGEARPWVPGPTLDNGFGIGGQNGCLVLTPPDWH
jgi:3-oxoacyl-[acyl-carrier-protein] synthase II